MVFCPYSQRLVTFSYAQKKKGRGMVTAPLGKDR